MCAGAAEAGLLCRSSGGLGVWAGVGCGLEECGSLVCKGKKSLMSFFFCKPPQNKIKQTKNPQQETSAETCVIRSTTFCFCSFVSGLEVY